MEKQILIKVESTTSLDIGDMSEFQGNLKKLGVKARAKIENSIVRRGFCAPIFIWKSEDSHFIIDGHQRIIAVKSLLQQGYVIIDTDSKETNKLPVAYIKAENKKEAGELVLAYNSQYGDISKDSLRDFIESFEIDYPDIHENLALDIDIRSVFDEEVKNTNEEIDVGSMEETLDIVCPKCSFKFKETK